MAKYLKHYGKDISHVGANTVAETRKSRESERERERAIHEIFLSLDGKRRCAVQQMCADKTNPSFR